MADFNVFWITYPADLCNRKGSRQDAEKKWDKIDATTQEQIIINMRELMRVDRKVKKSGAGKPEWVWPMATTWLNQARWQDIENIKQSADMPEHKSKCSCGDPAQITNKCWACYESTSPQHKAHMNFMYSQLVKRGLGKNAGESKEDWIKRCREYSIPRLAKLRALRDMAET
jgi:hypothetical protein